MNKTFERIVTKEQLKRACRHNFEVFLETVDVEWTLSGLQRVLKQGWEIYALNISFDDYDAVYEEEMVNVFFLRLDKGDLHTKNTSLKLKFRGMGLSDLIRDFIEKYALAKGANRIYHYCWSDDFRSIVLNEARGHVHENVTQIGDSHSLGE